MIDSYVGSELEIFAHATNWKKYFSSLLSPFGKKVLEVGAGLGATTAVLCNGSQEDWLCLEPDIELLAQIDAKILSDKLPPCCRTLTGTLQELQSEELFDSILYIDVLEHIQNDRTELEQATLHLKLNGKLMVLSPAHQFLYSPFDQAIGHYRRYSHTSLEELTPPGCKKIKAAYLDSTGLILSLSNRLLLRQRLPTHEQIHFWDTHLIPISRQLDKVTGFHFGRSILFIWERCY